MMCDGDLKNFKESIVRNGWLEPKVTEGGRFIDEHVHNMYIGWRLAMVFRDRPQTVDTMQTDIEQ